MAWRYWYRFFSRRLDKELWVVKRLVRKGHVAIDIGAERGVYTYALAKVCARVEAFEPLPACARIIRASRARNVTVHEVALSSTSGERDLFVPRTDSAVPTGLASFTKPAGPFQTLPVRVRRLDDYGFRDVSFIKIDVEGHELEVLEGGRETLTRSRPVLLIEVEQRHLPFPMIRVFDAVAGSGYRGFFIVGGRVSPLSEFSYAVHQEPFLQNVLSPEYVNNFIFVPEESGCAR